MNKNKTITVTRRQLEVIQSIANSPTGTVSAGGVDNRVLRSLVSKKFVKTTRGSIAFTAAGKRATFGTKAGVGNGTFNV